LIEKLFKKEGNNNDTYFWLDPLLEGERLCNRFSRLFKLVVEKYFRVTNMLCLSENVGESQRKIKPPRRMEKMLSRGGAWMNQRRRKRCKLRETTRKRYETPQMKRKRHKKDLK